MPSEASRPRCRDTVDAGCFLVLLERLFWLCLPLICSGFRRLRHINRSHTQKVTSDKKGKPKKKERQKISLYKETRPELKLKVFAFAKEFGRNMGHIFYNNKIFIVSNHVISMNVALVIKLTRHKWGFSKKFFF